MTGDQAYALAKNYVKQTVLGGGAVVGKNVIISSIEPIYDDTEIIGNRITFSYTLDNGTEKTSSMDVMNGKDGGIGKETDPTVPEWAKRENKPTYSADEVGAVSAGSAMSYQDIDEVFGMVFGNKA